MSRKRSRLNDSDDDLGDLADLFQKGTGLERTLRANPRRGVVQKRQQEEEERRKRSRLEAEEKAQLRALKELERQRKAEEKERHAEEMDELEIMMEEGMHVGGFKDKYSSGTEKDGFKGESKREVKSLVKVERSLTRNILLKRERVPGPRPGLFVVENQNQNLFLNQRNIEKHLKNVQKNIQRREYLDVENLVL